MKLLTNDLKERFQKVGNQEEVKDPLVIAKFFNPTGAGTWYATEYNPNAKIFLGFVSIFGNGCDEWGYFSLEELEIIRLPLGLKIERDLHFSEERASKIPGIKIYG